MALSAGDLVRQHANFTKGAPGLYGPCATVVTDCSYRSWVTATITAAYKGEGLSQAN